ncbi:VTT domain-containing protein [Clostridium sp. LY3-2]|uniref:TVP38/TMEM64 family protein n=1 Tax=Clostridium sp. LY3-2 TaxID=2942482 RepID=UPI002152F07C|nr:VTT domain-containing protein [Clostridium sp. LY3-2]MCR6513857.1 VTT domain-containing protein [Clostridium sp. LY3-2]
MDKILEKRNKRKAILIFIISILVMILLYVLYKYLKITDINEFKDLILSSKVNVKFLYLMICFLQPIILPLPEPLIIMTGSLIFGNFSSAILGFLGTIFGIITMFSISKFIGEKVIKNFIKDKSLEKFNRYIEKNQALVIVFLFIIPILPDEVICIGSGFSNIKVYKFIILAILSKLLTVFMFAYSLDSILIKVFLGAVLISMLIIKLIISKKSKRIGPDPDNISF